VLKKFVNQDEGGGKGKRVVFVGVCSTDGPDKGWRMRKKHCQKWREGHENIVGLGGMDGTGGELVPLEAGRMNSEKGKNHRSINTQKKKKKKKKKGWEEKSVMESTREN